MCNEVYFIHSVQRSSVHSRWSFRPLPKIPKPLPEMAWGSLLGWNPFGTPPLPVRVLLRAEHAQFNPPVAVGTWGWSRGRRIPPPPPPPTPPAAGMAVLLLIIIILLVRGLHTCLLLPILLVSDPPRVCRRSSTFLQQTGTRTQIRVRDGRSSSTLAVTQAHILRAILPMAQWRHSNSSSRTTSSSSSSTPSCLHTTTTTTRTRCTTTALCTSSSSSSSSSARR